jgi:hypothetical protein
MMILSESIYKAWKEKKVYTAVFMDVAGAFNNVHHKRLIHNLRQRRMPETISRWINSFLQGRTTQLQFNGIRSESMATPAGVPQGSPLSPLLYMFYKTDLLEIAPQHQGIRLGFIDDIGFPMRTMGPIYTTIPLFSWKADNQWSELLEFNPIDLQDEDAASFETI